MLVCILLQANFLEVSSLSFVKELGVKGKESLIKKRTGSTQPGRAGCNCCGVLDSLVCVRSVVKNIPNRIQHA